MDTIGKRSATVRQQRLTFQALHRRNVMLTVTEAAKAHLAQLLTETDVTDDTAVRFVSEDNLLVPKLDYALPDDMIFAHDGRIVLVLDTGVADVLENSTLDIKDTDSGPQLALIN
jgi:Fe-S cluster assembly iron-binding protein IscA